MAVDLATAKLHLNLTTTDDDVLVARLILVAKDWLERQLGYTLATEYPAGVPPSIDHAQLMMVGHFYANREATMVGFAAGVLPLGVGDIVNDWRHWSWSDV